MLKLILLLVFGTLTFQGLSQSGKLTQYFGEPILTDSLSTIFIPIEYNESLLSSNKLAVWGAYYANIIIYDFKDDSYNKLFQADTYIKSFNRYNNYRNSTELYSKYGNGASKWLFLFVKNVDTNNNGRIDEGDPSILYAATTKGQNLKALTNENENVVSFDLFEKQGFGLIKIQRDSNKDRSFSNKDQDIYFKKINLNDLSFGKEIKIN